MKRTRTLAAVTALTTAIVLVACSDSTAPGPADGGVDNVGDVGDVGDVAGADAVDRVEAGPAPTLNQGTDGAGNSGPSPTAPQTSPEPEVGGDTTFDGRSGDSSGSHETNEDSASIRDRSVYWNVNDFDYLEYPDMIMPGARYLVPGAGGSASQCSFGWTVSTDDRYFNLTAGHCGDPGDEVWVQTSNGDEVYVGQFVWQAYDGEHNISVGDDYALIEYSNDVLDAVSGTPDVYYDSVQVDLQGWQDSAWLEETRPYICRLGFRTGLSCGNFDQMTNDRTMRYDNISNTGDSGGPIWAVDPSDPTDRRIYAVGVTSFIQMDDATSAGGKTIEPVMTGQNLTVHR